MNYLFKGISVLVFVLGIGAIVQWNIVQNIDLFYSVWSIYLFHFLVAIAVFCAVFFVNKWQPTYIGYVFLASTTLQMLACVLFLIPLISASIEDKTLDVFSFMTPYFVCLLAEMIFSVMLIKKADSTFEK